MDNATVVKVFREAYGIDVCFVETFVNTESHDGACYRTAGFELAGMTAGRGCRGDHVRKKGETATTTKMLFMKALDPDSGGA